MLSVVAGATTFTSRATLAQTLALRGVYNALSGARFAAVGI